jgi:integrase
MTDEINVIVVKRKGLNLYLRYIDPVDGRRREKNSGTTNMKAAQRAAGEWQAELRAGGTSKLNTRWSVFTEAYESAKVVSLRENTMNAITVAFNAAENTMKPDTLARITPQWAIMFQQRLLDSGCAASTVESYCRHLRAALNWAVEQGMMLKVPKFPKLKQARSAKQMKGRPITGEEFDRLLEAVETSLKPRQHESMKFLLRGLWLSGLRLGEALSLTWDQWADGIRVDLSGKYVMLLIPAEGEKGGRDRTYPVTPDFAEFLLSVPKDQRTGFVFNPELYRGVCRRMDTVSKAIADLGEVANVKVDEKPSKAKGKPSLPVWASAHDLRRAFGFRWSRKVNSMVLKELMRHASVTTTEKYYIGIQADETAAYLAGLMPEVNAGERESAEPPKR